MFEAVHDGQPTGVYHVSTNGPRTFLSVEGGDVLVIASETARDEFRRRIDSYCPDQAMGWQGWEMHRRGMG